MSYQESLSDQIEKAKYVEELKKTKHDAVEEFDCQIDAAELDAGNAVNLSVTKLEDMGLDIGEFLENIVMEDASQIKCLNFLTAVCDFTGIDMPDDARISGLVNAAEEKAA